jgi:hypothetical protein
MNDNENVKEDVPNWVNDVDTDDLKKEFEDINKGNGADELKSTSLPKDDKEDNSNKKRGRPKGSTNKNNADKQNDTPNYKDKDISALIEIYVLLCENIPNWFGLNTQIKTNESVRDIFKIGMVAWVKDNKIDLQKIYKYVGIVVFILMPIVYGGLTFKIYKETNKNK